jgi:hypothetical protein
VAAWLDQAFECAWMSMRPAPKAEVDFGDGRKLTRTLNGNIATLFCLPDGRVADLLPGLVGPREFLRRAREAAGLIRAALRSSSPGTVLAAQHRLMAEAPAPASREALAEDTDYNRRERYPKAHAMLAERGLVRPEQIARDVYREILDVDLDDPYLGLAPYVAGGEGGRE